MKLRIFLILFIFLYTFSALGKECEIDNIAAIVNNEVILNSDVKKILSILKKEKKDIKSSLKSDFMYNQILEKLIINQLILEESIKKHVIVTEDQVNNILKNIAIKQNMTIDQFKNKIFSNNFYEYLNYIQNIRKLLRIKITQDNEVRKRVHISENEFNRLFQKIVKNNNLSRKINLSCILLPTTSQHNKINIISQKFLSDIIVKKLNQGYDFKELYQGNKKGNNIFLIKNMSWINVSDIQKIFPNMFNLFKKGQIISIFVEKKGFYIFQIHDIKNNEENIIKEFHIQHLLIKPSIILSETAAKKKISYIYENITKGIYSFDYAVKNLSHDFYSSNKKGDLGWVSNKFFNNNFMNVLNNLNKNHISKPIRSSFGWHIVKLLDTRETDEFYQNKSSQVYRFLLNKKMISERYKWIQDLKKMSFIKIIKK